CRSPSRRERPDRRARGNPRRQRRRFDRELERLAEATGRSKSWLINEALRSYVANEQQFLAAVEEGKQAPRAGQVCRSRDGRGSILNGSASGDKVWHALCLEAVRARRRSCSCTGSRA